MSTSPPLARRAFYPIADAALGMYGRFRARSYHIEDTIVVASSGRGGSTWLAEIVTTLPGYHMLWEPLHLGNNPSCQDHGFGWQNYVSPGSEAPEKRAYLERILTGSELSTRTLTSLSFDTQRLLRLRGYVVKFVNANMLLRWMADTFPVRTLLMIRHPCAVVSSQITHGAWESVTRDTLTVPSDLFDDHPHYLEVFETLDHPEEVLAFEWAIQTHVPLMTPKPHPWLLTTYEQMVEDGPDELARLFAYLGEPVPDEARARLRTASATTVASSNVAKGRNPLEGWRRKLSDQQVQNILRVTREMGVTYYSESLRPNLDRLDSIGRPAQPQQAAP